MVLTLGDRFYALSQLGEIFGLHRQTVKKRLASVKPDGLIRGNPAYTIKTAARHLVEARQSENVARDPDLMDPADAKDYWEAKIKEQKFNEAEGELWRSDEVLAALSGFSKKISMALRGIPDILERRTGLDAKQMNLVEDIVRAAMTDMHATVVEEYGGEPD